MNQSRAEGDCTSPECLMLSEPVTDPYSSNDSLSETEHMLNRRRQVKKTHKESKNTDFPNISNLALNHTNDGSGVKAEQNYFFLGMRFPQLSEDIPFENRSLNECLVHLFKFSSSHFFEEQGCTWNGETISDIQERELRKPEYKWFIENDNIDWKTASAVEVSDYEEMLLKQRPALLESYNMNLYSVAEKTRCLYQELQLRSELKSIEDRCLRHIAIKQCINAIATFLSTSHFLQNEGCAHNFNFYVPHDVLPADSPLIPDGRAVVFRNKPDGVFTYQPHGEFGNLWLIPVEVYVPQSEKEIEQHRFSPAAVSPQGSAFIESQLIYAAQGNVLRSSPDCLNQRKKIHTSPASYLSSPVSKRRCTGRIKPSYPSNTLPSKPLIDSLFKDETVANIRKRIAKSVPKQCRNYHCLDQIAGCHVQQLLSVAERSRFPEDERKNGLIEVIGLFVVNEYIYFSRLNIERELLYYFSGAPYKKGLENEIINRSTKLYKQIDPPSTTFANFRLDFTIAKHRLALLIFLQNYRKAFIYSDM